MHIQFLIQFAFRHDVAQSLTDAIQPQFVSTSKPNPTTNRITATA
jgi:hypothetical protein